MCVCVWVGVRRASVWVEGSEGGYHGGMGRDGR